MTRRGAARAAAHAALRRVLWEFCECLSVLACHPCVAPSLTVGVPPVWLPIWEPCSHVCSHAAPLLGAAGCICSLYSAHWPGREGSSAPGHQEFCDSATGVMWLELWLCIMFLKGCFWRCYSLAVLSAPARPPGDLSNLCVSLEFWLGHFFHAWLLHVFYDLQQRADFMYNDALHGKLHPHVAVWLQGIHVPIFSERPHSHGHNSCVTCCT